MNLEGNSRNFHQKLKFVSGKLKKQIKSLKLYKKATTQSNLENLLSPLIKPAICPRIHQTVSSRSRFSEANFIHTRKCENGMIENPQTQITKVVIDQAKPMSFSPLIINLICPSYTKCCLICFRRNLFLIFSLFVISLSLSRNS